MDNILILEEKQIEGTGNLKLNEIKHHKPIINAIIDIGDKTNPFDFMYAQKEEESIFPENEVFQTVSEYKFVILMGSKLFNLITGEQLKNWKNKIFLIGDIKIIGTESSHTLYNNGTGCNDAFRLMYKHWSGNILEKDFTKYKTIETTEELINVMEYSRINNIFSFDYETSSLRYFDNEQVAHLMTITFQPGFSYIIIMEYPNHHHIEQCIENIKVLRPYFEDPTITKVGHNIKFDMHWNRKYSIGMRGRIADTMLMSFLLNENRRHGLKDLCAEYFPFWAGYDDGIVFKDGYVTPLPELTQYAAIDSDVTLRLFYIFEYHLRNDPKLYRVLRNLMMPATYALCDIEHQGAFIDREFILKSLSEAYTLLENRLIKLNSYPEVKHFIEYTNSVKVNAKISELLDKIEKREELILKKSATADTSNDRFIKSYREQINDYDFGNINLFETINFSSPQQMNDLLYSSMGFHFKLPKSAKGEMSSNREVIQEIDHPFINDLLGYRTIQKMISTYYEGILERLDSDDYIHTSFLIHGTVTGRLSSKDPNLQNIPQRLKFDDEDVLVILKNVKKFFTVHPDYKYTIQSDYAQAELRMIANISGDKTMIESYHKGIDLHVVTGAKISDMTIEEFIKSDIFAKRRKEAKGANFGMVYKVSPEGYIGYIKQITGQTIDAETEAIHRKAIFGTYKDLTKWHKRYETLAKEQGYVETIFGQRRRFLNIQTSSNMGLVNKDIRDAINAPIQGSSGQLTLFNITLLWHRLPPTTKIWSTVHDSIMFYSNNLEDMKIVNDTCESSPLYEYFGIKPDQFPVPMKMDYSISEQHWEGMEEIGDFDKFLNHINSL